MELSEFEYRIGKSRHYEVKQICKYCGQEFWPKWTRVKKGQGKFCSRNCFRNNAKENATKFGKENAFFYWRKDQQIWVAGWYDKDRKQHRKPKARWLWEENYGEIPKNMLVTFIDGNSKNCELDNLKLISRSESNRIHLVGHYVSDEARRKMSEFHSRKVLSEEHKRKIGDQSRKLWADGRFDDVHCGENNPNWRGGINAGYPRMFSKKLKDFIKSRDNYKCAICGKRVYKSRYAHVHHIDGDKINNNPNNLILLCAKCHISIHFGNQKASDEILAFRSKLIKEDYEEYMIQ